MVLHNPADITLGLILLYVVSRKHAPLVHIGDVSIACGWRKRGPSTGQPPE